METDRSLIELGVVQNVADQGLNGGRTFFDHLNVAEGRIFARLSLHELTGHFDNRHRTSHIVSDPSKDVVSFLLLAIPDESSYQECE